ncbi:hypothetical protein PTI45_03923 [Paenibacillus nuruki]|uniref:Uncharacterized protein n=1 Tax=Paenibacillus nuruki TaxID=1886670 RepID=A0A1E3KZN8_9BACL|nr:hypothetical protein PTI45_03923 [Paenibacillus nuruki]
MLQGVGVYGLILSVVVLIAFVIAIRWLVAKLFAKRS